MKLFLCLNCIIFVLGCSIHSLPGDEPKTLTKEQWQKDTKTLKSLIKERHPNPFITHTEAYFDSISSKFIQSIPTLSQNQIWAGLSELVALTRSGHSYVEFFQKPLTYEWNPVLFYNFEDGIFLVDAKDNTSLIGAKLVKINDIPISDIQKLVLKYSAGETDYYDKDIVPLLLANASLLKAEKIIPDNDNFVTFTLEQQGRFTTLKSTFINSAEYLDFIVSSNTIRNDGFSTGFIQTEEYLSYHDAASDIYVIRINSINDQPALLEFIGKIKSDISKETISKYVIDLRFNTGGNQQILQPFVMFIEGTPEINERGKLFVLIGRKTFSAAVDLVGMLERRTSAILVGEPTGGAVKSYGESMKLTLPNSGIRVAISSRYWENSIKGDNRTAYIPDFHIRYNSQDYFNGIDPTFEFIKNYTNEKRKVSSIEIDNFLGIYQFSPFQKAQILKKDGQYIFKVYDFETFINTNLHSVADSMLETDINNCFLKLNEKSGNIEFSWNDATRSLEKLADQYETPCEILQKNEVSEAISLFREISKTGWVFDSRLEIFINESGYRLITEKEIEKARDLFLLNIELFPHSPNTYDSLAEAYLMLGDKTNAKKYYQIAFVLNPENDFAMEQLKDL